MVKIHRGATLTPHFRDFLPVWMARQPWYRGDGIPAIALIGAFRFEDPAGQVGIETHLVSDGSTLYQIPMTYRGAPLGGDAPRASDELVVIAEHSVLGTRWIYDGATDPVWRDEVLRLIQTNGTADSSGRKGIGLTEARGRLRKPIELTASAVTVELTRVVTEGDIAAGPDVAGVVIGSWCPAGPGTPAVTGCLAVVRVEYSIADRPAVC